MFFGKAKYTSCLVVLTVAVSYGATHDVNDISFDRTAGKRVEISYPAEGGFLAVTDDARYEYVPGLLKVYQVHDSEQRLVATAAFDGKYLFEKSSESYDRALVWSERLNAGVGGNSSLILAAKGNVTVSVTGMFTPSMLVEGDSLFAVDAKGSIRVSNNWDYYAKAALGKDSQWSVSYKLVPGRKLTISIDTTMTDSRDDMNSSSTGGTTSSTGGGTASSSTSSGASGSSGGAAGGGGGGSSAGGASSGASGANIGSNLAGAVSSDSTGESTSTSTRDRHFGSSAPTVFVSVLPSYERVLRSEVPVIGDSNAAVFCAKNETESFQILVVNKSYNTLWNVNLVSKDWQPAVTSSRAPSITLFREHYVRIRESSGNRNIETKLGEYPDALVPFVDPYNQTSITYAKYLAASQPVQPSTSQSYWIDISVGNDVAAGVYRNEIEVYANNTRIATVPVTLTVWDFELPDTQTLKSWFGQVLDVSSYHSVARSSTAYRTIEKRYMQMLRQHGAVPLCAYEPLMDFHTGAVEFPSWYVAKLREYVDQMQPMTTYLPSNFDRMQPTELARHLSAWQQFIQENPWIPEPFMIYDEPRTLEAYQKVITYGTAMHTYAPSIKFLVTEQVEPRKPGWPSLEGYVDIWCPLWHLGDADSLARRRALGDSTWSYVALTQSLDVPAWLIDFPLINYRIPAWFSFNLDLDGILYWQTMQWAARKPKIDPWVDSETFVLGEDVWNGEASLVYPGSDAGIDGPIASMRLKVFRDGIEDHEYLSVLSDLIGTAEVKKIVLNVAKDFKTYSNSPYAYMVARRQVAERILLEKNGHTDTTP